MTCKGCNTKLTADEVYWYGDESYCVLCVPDKDDEPELEEDQ